MNWLMKMLTMLTMRSPSRPLERSRYGCKVDPVVVSHACQRVDEVLQQHPDIGPKVDKIICTLILERHLGLSDLREHELRRVLNHLRMIGNI